LIILSEFSIFHPFFQQNYLFNAFISYIISNYLTIIFIDFNEVDKMNK